MRAVLVALVACCSLGLALAYRPKLHPNQTETGCPGRPSSFSKLVLCYYEGRAAAAELDPCLCSHLVLTNAARFPEESSKAPLAPMTLDSGLAAAAESLRRRNPELRVLGRVSGGARAALTTSRGPEVATALARMARHAGLDGLEVALDWEGARVGGGAHGKQRLVALIKGIRSAMIVVGSQGGHRKRRSYAVYEEIVDDIPRPSWNSGLYVRSNGSVGALSSTTASPQESQNKPVERVQNEPLLLLQVSAKPGVLGKRFDLKPLSKYVDYFTVPSHNLTDDSERGVTFHHSRLMGLSDILNTDSVLDLLTGLGAPASRLIMTLPASGLRFQLQEQSRNEPRSPAAAAPPTAISHQQVCSLLAEGGWMVERDEDLTAPYAFRNDSWIAFDDELSVEIKGKYALLRGLAGVAVWSVDDDDLENTCGRGRSGLTRALSSTLASMARRTRSAVLQSLVEPLAAANSPLFVPVAASSSSGSLSISPYRVVRVVDRAGAVQVLRRDAQTEFTCSRQGYYRHPQGCDRFYRCVKFDQRSDDYSVFEYDCPSGLAFDERWEVCVWPGLAAPCDGSSEIRPVPRSKFACSSPGYYADPENCRWFFACMDHKRDGSQITPYEFRCPYGLGFDEQNLMCNWPWMVPNCCGAYSASDINSATLGVGVQQVITGGGGGGYVKQQQKITVAQVPVINTYQPNLYQGASVGILNSNLRPYTPLPYQPVSAGYSYPVPVGSVGYPASLINVSPGNVNEQLQANRPGLLTVSPQPQVPLNQNYVSNAQVSNNDYNNQYNEATLSVNSGNQYNGNEALTTGQVNINNYNQEINSDNQYTGQVTTNNNQAQYNEAVSANSASQSDTISTGQVTTTTTNNNNFNQATVSSIINSGTNIQQTPNQQQQNNFGILTNTNTNSASSQNSAVNQFQTSQFSNQNIGSTFQSTTQNQFDTTTTPAYDDTFSGVTQNQNSVFQSQSNVNQNSNFESQSFAAGVRDENSQSQFISEAFPNAGPVGIQVQARPPPPRTGITYLNKNFKAVTESSVTASSTTTASSSSVSSDSEYTLSDAIANNLPINNLFNDSPTAFGSRLPIANIRPFADNAINNFNAEFGSRLPQTLNTFTSTAQEKQSTTNFNSRNNFAAASRVRTQQNSVTILSPNNPSSSDLGVINVADFSFQSPTRVPDNNLGPRRFEYPNLDSTTPPTASFSARPTVAGVPSVSDIVLTASPVTESDDESSTSAPSSSVAPSSTQAPVPTFGTRVGNRNDDTVQSLLDSYSGRFGGLFDNDKEDFIQDVISTRNRGDNSRGNNNNNNNNNNDRNNATPLFGDTQNTPSFAADNSQQYVGSNFDTNSRNLPINGGQNNRYNSNDNSGNSPTSQNNFDNQDYNQFDNNRDQNRGFDQIPNTQPEQNKDQFVNNQRNNNNNNNQVNQFDGRQNINQDQINREQNINQDPFDFTTQNSIPENIFTTNRPNQDEINIGFVNNGQFFAEQNPEVTTYSGNFVATSTTQSAAPQRSAQYQTTTQRYNEFDEQSVEPQNLDQIGNSGFDFSNFDSQRESSQRSEQTSTEQDFNTARATPRVRPSNSRQGFNQRTNQNFNTQPINPQIQGGAINQRNNNQNFNNQPINVPNNNNNNYYRDESFVSQQDNSAASARYNQFDALNQDRYNNNNNNNNNNRGSVRFSSTGNGGEQQVSSSIQTSQVSQGRQGVTDQTSQIIQSRQGVTGQTSQVSQGRQGVTGQTSQVSQSRQGVTDQTSQIIQSRQGVTDQTSQISQSRQGVTGQTSQISQSRQVVTGRQGVTVISRPADANSLPLVEKLQGAVGQGLGRKFDRYGPGGWRSANETLGPEACQREGLFRHPQDCNKFYECFYDSWKEKYTLHFFNCPIRLAYDPSISACNWPVDGPGCSGNHLLLHA